MDVNKIKIKQTITPQEIVVPFDMRWDFMNREDSIIAEEKSIIEKVIGSPTNYELVRFSRRPVNARFTNQGYDFYFYSGVSTTWENSYLTRFSENQIVYNSSSFKKSFFKLDLYDSVDPAKQKIYLTIILEARQGLPDIPDSLIFDTYYFGSIFTGTLTYTNCNGDVINSIVNFNQLINFCPQTPQFANFNYINPITGAANLPIPLNDTVFPDPSSVPLGFVAPFFYGPTGEECDCVDNLNNTVQYTIKPKMILDFVGDQEGYFIYWYEDRNVLNIDTLYMRAKFFDGNNGTYTTFTIEPQSNYPGSETTMNNELFYYQVNFDYPNKHYWISRVGLNVTLPTLEWYEYVNPPII
jgi:hypothetical protein